jgi:hypothetical protein
MPSSAVRRFTDPDALHAAIRDAHAEGIVTARGNFRAEFTSVRLDRISLARSEETLPRVSYCAVDPALFGIVFATYPDQQYTSTASHCRKVTSSSTAQVRRGTIVLRPPVDGVPSL